VLRILTVGSVFCFFSGSSSEPSSESESLGLFFETGVFFLVFSSFAARFDLFSSADELFLDAFFAGVAFLGVFLFLA